MTKQTADNTAKKHLPGVPFVKGDPRINLNGRPKGSLSIKTLLRQYLEDHPEDLQKFVEHFAKKNKELGWQMLEGSPKATVDANVTLEQPILGGTSRVPADDGSQEDPSSSETN